MSRKTKPQNTGSRMVHRAKMDRKREERAKHTHIPIQHLAEMALDALVDEDVAQDKITQVVHKYLLDVKVIDGVVQPLPIPDPDTEEGLIARIILVNHAKGVPVTHKGSGYVLYDKGRRLMPRNIAKWLAGTVKDDEAGAMA